METFKPQKEKLIFKSFKELGAFMLEQEVYVEPTVPEQVSIQPVLYMTPIGLALSCEVEAVLGGQERISVNRY